ncbi:hypothetical protein Forpe1208_v013815 [Fusarium oxysporum f. sp. rapae]|uniref:2EXR domain-containing protein n=1 Tax=Fusarium oxysporum f. sp. rapae TaxID=485398 RepID=A0A8J5NTN0_FUSOX|nr:hypothetical protein Forpe1208_v013815 [Fusarium oxysporum f. sp. rapae]
MVVEDPDHGDRRKQTEDTLALSSNEMSSPTFHPFPNLPPELRLQIWKSACFPFTANESGLHYADLANLPDKNLHEAEDLYWSPIEMIALLPDFQTSPKPLESVGRPNGSVYMWDAGLWKACRESRGVIAAHCHLHILPKGEPSFPNCLFLRNKEPAAPLMVMPTRDIFCTKNLGLPSLPPSLYYTRLHSLGLGGQITSIRHPFNLALEFDSSWNDEFPSDWYQLKRENSPRGLLVAWLESYREDNDDEACIYLLNKAARFDDDYTGCYPTCPEETSATLRFLQCVRELWTAASCEDCSYEETCYDGVFDPDFDISKHFKVLVRHEREVGEGEREDGLVDENDDNEDEIEQDGQEGKGISES